MVSSLQTTWQWEQLRTTTQSEEAVIKSFLAGSDLLLIVRDYDNEINAMKALITAVETGVITEERLNESVKRILSLKKANIIIRCY